MELGQLYQVALMLTLVGMIIGVGVLTLDKFSNTSGVSSTANTSIQAARDAVSGLATNWLTLIVTIVALAIILTLVIRSFAVRGR